MKLARPKTKIIATIGPASDRLQTLESMIRAGMSVARLNLAHGDCEHHAQTIQRLRQASSRVGRPLAILADLPGPKLRIGQIHPEPVQLSPGQPFTLTLEPVTGDHSRVSVSFRELPQAVRAGDRIFLNDGFIELKVQSVDTTAVHCKVMVGGELRSHKGINIPNLRLPLPAFTDHDRQLFAFACAQQVDAVSISFVAGKEDIERVRDTAKELAAEPFLIAKIERAAALPRIDQILAAADGIMVARGDLGVEMPIETIPITQKNLIRKANLAAKPVITATQMLESMTGNTRPTRAEATDVANAVLDGTDAVMLSEESALGQHPVTAVRMLGKIARQAESDRARSFSCGSRPAPRRRQRKVTEVITLNVLTAVEHLACRYVFTPTETGATARRLASHHLPAWIVALCPKPATRQQLLLSYGVHPVHSGADARPWSVIARQWLAQQGVKHGTFVITQGPSRGHPGGTNQIEILPVRLEDG